METNTNIMQIPLSSPVKHNNSKYNVILYDDNTLWIGRNSISSYDKIMIKPNYYRDIPNCSDSVFIVDLIGLTYREMIANFDIRNLNPIGKIYFSVKTENELLVFHWNNLLKMNEGLKPIAVFPVDVFIYPVNWRESYMIKITEGSVNYEFLDEHFNIMFSVHIKHLFNHYEPIESLYEEQDVMSIVAVNDNCFMYIECRELVEERRHIIEPGFKQIYCFDLTNNTEIHFENGEIEYIISNIIPYRNNGIVKYIANEFYPAGNWIKRYNSTT
jgi:hypothetical protein